MEKVLEVLSFFLSLSKQPHILYVVSLKINHTYLIECLRYGPNYLHIIKALVGFIITFSNTLQDSSVLVQTSQFNSARRKGKHYFRKIITMAALVCKYNQNGYCKFGIHCRNRHVKEICRISHCKEPVCL